MSEHIGGVGRGWWSRAKFHTMLWLLMLPTLAGLVLFTYFPNLESVKYAFYRWDGSSVEEFRWFENFQNAFLADPLFWQTFWLIGVLLVANLIKMWPSIFAAIVLHRIKNERWQYVYRVLFVLPMVVPGLVALLLWKGFFDGQMGILNAFLNGTGLMSLLAWLDHTMPGVAASLNASWPIHDVIRFIFGGLGGFCLWAVSILLLIGGVGTISKNWMLWLPFMATAGYCWGPFTDPVALAVRGPLLLGATAFIVEGLRRQDPILAKGRIAAIAWSLLMLGAVLIMLTQVWVKTLGAFDTGHPAWLGHSKLVIPSVILWGFPWIGTVGVLIYLAGLSNISKEVYEAAELDGVGFWGKIFRIELPLILTQVRINLIFMTIGTLGEFGFFLLLLGPQGGPDNIGMTPGLYMFREAFVNRNMGYACALGMVMFMLILYLTVLYQRHFKVEK
jgi:ABC-type sugar transport system permease subunit